jgi:hypothetical protein
MEKERVNERIVERLQKVLALMSSPMEGEAQAAAHKLEELLTLHNLSMADLEMKGGSKPDVLEDKHDLGKAAFTWKLNLAEGIAKYYYCHPIVNRYAKTVRFVGRKDNVESLKMLYSWLIDQIKRISGEERKIYMQKNEEHIDPLRWQVNFGIGAVSRLQEMLKEKTERDNQSVMALVVHHETEISDYMEKQYGYRTDGQKTEREKEQDKEREERRKRKEELKARDLEAYYQEYPWERPLTEKEQAKRDKEQAKADRAWEKRWERRNSRESRKTYSIKDLEKMRQGRDSRKAGYAAGSRLNLEPFVENKGTEKRALNN